IGTGVGKGSSGKGLRAATAIQRRKTKMMIKKIVPSNTFTKLGNKTKNKIFLNKINKLILNKKYEKAQKLVNEKIKKQETSEKIKNGILTPTIIPLLKKPLKNNVSKNLKPQNINNDEKSYLEIHKENINKIFDVMKSGVLDKSGEEGEILKKWYSKYITSFISSKISNDINKKYKNTNDINSIVSYYMKEHENEKYNKYRNKINNILRNYKIYLKNYKK
ncbi:MAG: hypothetical protein ACP5RI_04040, partial [Candidatus Micrarchaeia archaeon]